MIACQVYTSIIAETHQPILVDKCELMALIEKFTVTYIYIRVARLKSEFVN